MHDAYKPFGLPFRIGLQVRIGGICDVLVVPGVEYLMGVRVSEPQFSVDVILVTIFFIRFKVFECDPVMRANLVCGS